jgi:hypothetical protein
MTPAFFTAQANKYYPRRRQFLGISIAAFACLALVIFAYSGKVSPVAPAFIAPFIFVPWALLCICVWFHPVNGNLQPNSRFVGRLPKPIQQFVRWYAAIFLVVFVLFALFFPVFAVTTI